MWAAAVTGGERYWEVAAVARPVRPHTGSAAEALLDAVGDALKGQCLTRAELIAAIEDRLGWTHPAFRSGFGELLHPAAMTGRLCFGPPRGTAVTFVRADEWLGGWPDIDPGTARREALRRFLHVYGPARPADFAGVVRIRRRRCPRRCSSRPSSTRFASVAPAPSFSAATPRGSTEYARSVRLLPQYDAYILGSRPRDPSSQRQSGSGSSSTQKGVTRR